jgi:hypothetical protein
MTHAERTALLHAQLEPPHPDHRRRHGHHDPAPQAGGSRLSRGAETRFADWHQDVKGNNDLLVLTQPEMIRGIHDAYCAAGADLLETNSLQLYPCFSGRLWHGSAARS